jgi:hypothetical protein
MKKLILLIFFGLLINNLQAQDSSRSQKLNNLKTGDKYKVVLLNHWETIGILTLVDSENIKIKNERKEFTIPKSQIIGIGNPEIDSRDLINEYNKADDENITVITLRDNETE